MKIMKKWKQSLDLKFEKKEFFGINYFKVLDDERILLIDNDSLQT